MSSAALSNASPAREEPQKDCLSCRIVGASAFTGLGGYALYTANQQGTFRTVRPRGQPMVAGKVTAILGVVFIGLGIGRLVV